MKASSEAGTAAGQPERAKAVIGETDDVGVGCGLSGTETTGPLSLSRRSLFGKRSVYVRVREGEGGREVEWCKKDTEEAQKSRRSRQKAG